MNNLISRPLTPIVDNDFPVWYSDKELKPTLQSLRISIVGLGYVGAVSVACLASCGHKVIGVDTDEKKVADMRLGVSPILEENLPELLCDGVVEDRIVATRNLNAAILETDITFVCVGTPSDEDGSCDLTALKSVASTIGQALKQKNAYHLVVIRSTVPPGTTRFQLLPLIEKVSGKQCGTDFGLCFHPEFLREGTAINDFYSPPKTVVGSLDPKSAQILAKLYKGIDDQVICTSIDAAETVKYVDNTWHALKVSFANEVGKICQACSIDSHEVMDIFVQDTKLNLSPYYLKPGFAYGGSCLPKDVRGINHLAESLGVETPVLASIAESNRSQIDHAISLIEETNSEVIGFLGVTFKADTNDLRETPVLPVIISLLKKGYDVRLYDPNLDVEQCYAHHQQHSKASEEDELSIETLNEIVCDDLSFIKEISDTLVVVHNKATYRKAVIERRDDQSIIDFARIFEPFKTKNHIFEAGMNDYIQKPCSKEVLMSKLYYWVRQKGGEALNVLIAEDNPANARVVQAMLIKEGHKAIIAEDGEAALTEVNQHKFDVILMDIAMPKMNGLNAAMAIRARGDDKSTTPIIAMTAYADPEESKTYKGICW